MPNPTPTSGKFVLGTGPLPARLMCLGRNPGIQESHIGVSFVGSAGKELSMYMLYSELQRRESYITNLFKLFTEEDIPPVSEQYDAHWAIVEKELLLAQPEVLMVFGDDAAEYLCGRLGIEFRGLDAMAGVPLRAELGITQQPLPSEQPDAMPWLRKLWHDAPEEGHLSFVLFPSFHPAAGLHQPTSMCKIDHCFKELARLLRGELEPRDPHAPQHTMVRRLLESPAEVKALFAQADDYIGLDTEGSATLPWGLTFSVTDWEGYCILAHQEAILGEFIHQLGRYFQRGGKLIIHNSLHDISVLEAMGIHLPDGSYIDTMVMAYLLGIEPQGLKPLSYRHHDIKMQAYEDVIEPYEKANMVDYLKIAQGVDWDACPKCEAYRGRSTFHPLGGFESLPPELLMKDGKHVRKAYEHEILWCDEQPTESRAHTISRRLDRLMKDFAEVNL